MVHMLHILHALGPLWRPCTSLRAYRSLPGGTRGLQIREAGFDSPVACPLGGWSSGKAPGCNPGDRGFESRSALHDVVTPTQGCRIAARGITPGWLNW